MKYTATLHDNIDNPIIVPLLHERAVRITRTGQPKGFNRVTGEVVGGVVVHTWEAPQTRWVYIGNFTDEAEVQGYIEALARGLRMSSVVSFGVAA